MQTVYIDENKFFEVLPKKAEDSYKGSFGKILLISGSYGMAGAACLNITGAKALGASYIHVALPEEIYPVVAANHVTPVFNPVHSGEWQDTLCKLLPKMRAVCFGSGAVHNKEKETILEVLKEQDFCPAVLDAEALNLIKTGDLKQFKRPVVITPHIGEFCALTGLSEAFVNADRVKAALETAEKSGSVVVLKGNRTVVASPDGRVCINSSGNQALAQAGSGDVLTGMTCAMLSFTGDPFDAACCAVFAHGLAADEGVKTHSFRNFPLEDIPKFMDAVFKRHGF